MKPGIRTYLGVGFVLAVAVLALNAAVAISGTRRLAENNRRALRTAEALRLLERALSTINDAEAGGRGYFLTGQEVFLEPYESAGTKIADDTAENVKNDPKVIAAYLGVEDEEEAEAVASTTEELRP